MIIEEKLVRRIAPHLQRVLVVDGSSASARLLVDLLKGLGAGEVRVETSDAGAMTACKAFNPQLVFTELAGGQVDGLAFARALRRSTLNARKAPIVMLTAEATAAAIVAARNAGVHEFLRKPFTTRDLLRRLEAVTLRSRDWIEAINYIGPDRRRFNSGGYQGPRKRRTDQPAMADAERVRQALTILKAAIEAIDTDPAQALRAMQAQAEELKRAAVAMKDANLLTAATAFEACVDAAVAKGGLSRSAVATGSAALWAFLPPADAPAAA
jgi:DNA-binding response OmpR family regulator